MVPGFWAIESVVESHGQEYVGTLDLSPNLETGKLLETKRYTRYENETQMSATLVREVRLQEVLEVSRPSVQQWLREHDGEVIPLRLLAPLTEKAQAHARASPRDNSLSSSRSTDLSLSLSLSLLLGLQIDSCALCVCCWNRIRCLCALRQSGDRRWRRR